MRTYDSTAIDWIDGFKWQPGLDSLRALAVLHVMVHHSRVGKLVGWWGVDLFFVLSGFLITTILAKEMHRRGGLDFIRFYRRRAYRLLPAFYAMLIPVSVLGCLVIRTADDWHDFVVSSLAAMFYGINYLIAAAHPIFPPWGHLWSLCIEEQYYLLWPLTLTLLWRLKPRTMAATMGTMLLVLAVLVVGLLTGPDASPVRVYNGVEARAFELLAGGLAALLPCWLSLVRMQRLQRRIDLVAPYVFAILLLYGIAPVIQTRLSMGLHFLFMSLGTAVVVLNVAYGQSRTLSDLLTQSLLLYIGRLSYSIYLWNWPVAMLLGGELGWRPPITQPAAVTVTYFGLSMGLAMLSYHLVEVPIGKRYLIR